MHHARAPIYDTAMFVQYDARIRPTFPCVSAGAKPSKTTNTARLRLRLRSRAQILYRNWSWSETTSDTSQHNKSHRTSTAPIVLPRKHATEAFLRLGET